MKTVVMVLCPAIAIMSSIAWEYEHSVPIAAFGFVGATLFILVGSRELGKVFGDIEAKEKAKPL